MQKMAHEMRTDNDVCSHFVSCFKFFFWFKNEKLTAISYLFEAKIKTGITQKTS